MADPFDVAWDNAAASTAVAPSQPAVDPFDAAWENASVPASDFGAIRNSAVRGLGAPLGLLDLVLGTPMRAMGMETPSFAQDYKRLTTDFGLDAPARPATELGSYAENFAENAAGATAFGPLAMLLSGVTGGTGGYLGEKVAGPTGRTVGSVAGGLTPAGISKLGIVKEVGEAIGPTLSQIPWLNKVLGLGDEVVDAAVGRALSKQMTNADEVAATLKAANSIEGPQTQLASLKTVDEITGDVGLARATDAVDNMVGNAGIKQLGEERAAVRLADTLGVEKSYKPGTTDYALSKGLEQSLSKGIDEFETAVESPLWEALPKSQELVVNHLDDSLKATLGEITFDGAVPLEGQAKGLISLVDKAKEVNGGVLTMGQVQELRRRALQVGRAAKGDMTSEGEMARNTASAVETHLRDIVDSNAQAGVLPAQTVQSWEAARDATNLKYTRLSAQKEGTRNLENLTLKNVDLDNTKLLDEGLKSPDMLSSHLKAAELGGAKTLTAVKSQYRQALLKKLEDTRQTSWSKVIDDDAETWRLVFTPKELDRIRRNTDDSAAWVLNERNRVSTGSQTNPRGNIQKAINAEKGIANLGSGVTSAATVLAAGAGAKKGWDSGDSIGDKAIRGLLGGIIGASAGKAFKGATTRASDAFDSILVEAVTDPRTMERVLEAAKPSQFATQLKTVLSDAGKASGIKALGATGREMRSEMVSPQQQSAPTEVQADVPIAEETPMPLSPFVSKLEGGQKLKAYNPPDKGSGVTISTGVDLGQHSKKDLESYGLSPELIKKVSPYLEKKDDDAKKFLKENPLTLTKEEADELDDAVHGDILNAVSDKYAAATGAELSDLPEEARAVVESLAINFGKNLDVKIPTIWGKILENDWAEVQRLLRDTEWKQKSLKGRREQEASILGSLLERVV